MRKRTKLPTTKHKVEIYWSRPDNTFIAEAPDLPGCLADGSTRHEAVSNLETIIEEWIETANELGRHIPSHIAHLPQNES